VLEVIMSEFQQRFMPFRETLSVTTMNGEKCGYVKDIGFAKSRCSLNIKPECLNRDAKGVPTSLSLHATVGEGALYKGVQPLVFANRNSI